MKSDNRQMVGAILLILPPILVGFLYLVLQMINSSQAARASSPDQGSMVNLFLILVVGVIIGLIAMAIGFAMIFNSPKK